MSMATLEFIQSSALATPDVLFGDFSESEVASIIYKSSLFNKHNAICFGTFTEEEINDILDASHSTKNVVEFDFDELVSAALAVQQGTAPEDVVVEETVPAEVEYSVPEPEHTVVLPPLDLQQNVRSNTPNTDYVMHESAQPIIPDLSTPERTDIDAVLKILIEETVKSNNFAAQPQQQAHQGSYQYSAQPGQWQEAPTQQAWSNKNSSYATDYYQPTTTPEQIWSKPPQQPQSVWSNGGHQWSSLFKGSEPEPQVTAAAIRPHPVPTPSSKINFPQILSENIPVSSKDHELMMLGSQLQLMTISHHSLVNIVPRGLINKSTNCFAHAPLQALLVSPLYHIIQKLDSSYTLSPVLNAMKVFFSSFNVAGGIVDKMDPPFEPTCIYEMLRNKMPNFNENGRQEDAEEFLGIILSHLHDEMVSAIRSSKKTVSLSNAILANTEDGEWQQIGKKNKIQVTRNTSNNEPSPVSELFGGLTRSVVSKAGAKESATLQPFLSVQLDIQHPQINHVRDALYHFTHKEQIILNNAKCYRRETLESLPPVLILHLKRFIFDDAAKSCQKLHKEINFDVDMVIQDDMMSAIGTTMASERQYRLFGVVYHHGSHAAGGHYSAMIYHPYVQCWINADDDKVTHQNDRAVLKHIQGRSAYLLFYKRVA